MKVTEFLQGRDVERQAVTRYINRHAEIFDGHTSKEEKEIELDEVAVAELEKVYPLPKPVTIINGVPEEEHRKVLNELVQSQKDNLELKERLMDAREKNAMLEATKILLEDKTQRIDQLETQLETEKKSSEVEIAELKEKINQQEMERKSREEEIAELREKISQQESELAQKKNRSWFRFIHKPKKETD